MTLKREALLNDKATFYLVEAFIKVLEVLRCEVQFCVIYPRLGAFVFFC
jgi:hypothetical protein